MRLSHKMILLAGILGIIGFFMPVFKAGHMGSTVSVSSLKMVTEGEKVFQVRTTEDEENLKYYQIGTYVGFGGAAALLLVWLISLKRFGRGGGFLGLLFSLGAAGFGVLLFVACAEAKKKHGIDIRGIGVLLLLAAGGLGLLGSLKALVAPEKKG